MLLKSTIFEIKLLTRLVYKYIYNIYVYVYMCVYVCVCQMPFIEYFHF